MRCKKYRIIGHAVDAWFSHPKTDSSFLWDTFCEEMILLRLEYQCLHFLSGRAMVSDRVLITHLSITKHSDSWPSSTNLLNERQSSLTTGPFNDNGWHIVWMAKSKACIARLRLSCKSGTFMIPSSIKSSTFTHVSRGMSTSKLLACLNSSSPANILGSGIR